MDDVYRTFGPQTPLPPMGQIMQLWDTHYMLDNIRRHSEVVCAVALLLQDWLEQAGVMLNLEAVRAGALLHDLAKTQCLGSKRRHDLEGAQVLEDLGYPELAYLVRHHVRLDPEHPLDETMLVYYADKRVNHDHVVPVNQRYAYITSRYGDEDPVKLERIEAGRLHALQVEQLIFDSMFNLHTSEDVTQGWRKLDCIWQCAL